MSELVTDWLTRYPLPAPFPTAPLKSQLPLNYSLKSPCTVWAPRYLISLVFIQNYALTWSLQINRSCLSNPCDRSRNHVLTARIYSRSRKHQPLPFPFLFFFSLGLKHAYCRYLRWLRIVRRNRTRSPNNNKKKEQTNLQRRKIKPFKSPSRHCRTLRRV